MIDWIVIYNDGNNITTSSSKRSAWNQAPSNNVQYLILVNCLGHRKAIGGLDEYNINEQGSNRKFGFLLSKEEFKKTRNFMIYGDY